MPSQSAIFQINVNILAAPDELTPSEHFWSNNYDRVLSLGYRLRSPRVQPGWVASWRKYMGSRSYSRWPSVGCPDGIPEPRPATPALRLSDNTEVTLSYIDSAENLHAEECLRYLASHERRSDPDNCTVPIFAILGVPEVPHHHVIVMPAMKRVGIPSFNTVGEALEFIRDLFQAMAYLHEHKIAYRCQDMTLVKDPGGRQAHSHFPAENTPRGFASWRFSRNRWYLSGLENTILYSPTMLVDGGDIERDPLVQVTFELPVCSLGLRNREPYETHPFKYDVFSLGKYVLDELIEILPVVGSYDPGIVQYQELSFLRPLVEQMIHADPHQRPSMAQALESLDLIIGSLDPFTLYTRPVRGLEPWHATALFALPTLVRKLCGGLWMTYMQNRSIKPVQYQPLVANEESEAEKRDMDTQSE